MKLDRYLVEITLKRSQLGTNPDDADILGTHIIEKERKLILEKSKVNNAMNKYLNAEGISEERKQEEIDKIKDRAEELLETVGENDEKGITCFFRENDKICVGDHMIYGFLKAASEALIRAAPEKKKGTVMGSAEYTKSLINQHVRCEEEFIPFDKDIKRKADGTPDYLIRSLRALTPKGPRVSIAKSEQVPAGAKLKFVLGVVPGSGVTQKVLETLFDYGVVTGLGQWRNKGHGTFDYTLEKL